MSCSIPANQSIYQALLDKAASYPTDKPYQAKAYKKAAESVLKYHKNIYDGYGTYNWFMTRPDSIGDKIENFIANFIEKNPAPKPVVTTSKATVDPAIQKWLTLLTADYDSKKIPDYTTDNPRRSKRIASKPKVQYYNKKDVVADTIEDACVKKSQNLVTNFQDWLPYSATINDYTKVKESIRAYNTNISEKNLEKKVRYAFRTDV